MTQETEKDKEEWKAEWAACVNSLYGQVLIELKVFM